MKHPYELKESKAFWRSGVLANGVDSITDLYHPKWELSNSSKIFTAGSCFAQHVGRYLKQAGVNVLDAEPAPRFLSKKKRAKYGYELYSARYGNIYTVRQFRELLEEVEAGSSETAVIWEDENRYVDALRPSVEPEGFTSKEELLCHRRDHINAVKKALQQADVVVFTLGLTEAWVDTETGRTLPTAPGTIAGHYDPAKTHFKNYTFSEIVSDLMAVYDLASTVAQNSELKFILTVSPVPLAATWTEKHVRVSTTQSKAILRAAAGEIADQNEWADYFPSFEIVNNPWSTCSPFEPNLRDVQSDVVARIMNYFLHQHRIVNDPNIDDSEQGRTDLAATRSPSETVVCDEEILTTFAGN